MGVPRPCKTAEGCDRPKLLSANSDAWEAYGRVLDQIYVYPIGEKEEHVTLRAEALAAVIGLMAPDDPLETFDRSMLIHRVKYPG